MIERNDCYESLCERYKHPTDTLDDGYDFDDLIAICEELDKADEEMISPEEEAEESDEEGIDKKLLQVVPFQDRNEESKYLSKLYGKQFLDNMQRAYLKRCSEAKHLNLSFWKK